MGLKSIIAVGVTILLGGALVMIQPPSKTKLENFDELFVGDGAEIEQNLSNLLPEANAQENKSIYLQILSQIALAQAMQRKFQEAHATLDLAEESLTEEYPLAKARILLERGRVFHQSDNLEAALPLFIQSYEICKKLGLDFHAANAAHMVAIVVDNVDEKITWNERAIDLAQKSEDKRTQSWLGALYNNLAQSYVKAENWEKALAAFQQSHKHGDKDGQALVARGARWGIGRALRSLGQLDEARAIQEALLEEYAEVEKKGELPLELLMITRGVVYEELAELHDAFAKKYATLASADLSQNPWFITLEPQRLERLKKLKE